MTPYEIYIFILCLIVFLSLTLLFSVLIAYLIKLMIKLIRSGTEDENIKKEHLEMQKKKQGSGVLSKVFCGITCTAFLLCFTFSLCLRFTENSFLSDMPSLKIVKSPSMSEKYSGNIYLFQNDLNDRLSMFDLIVTNPLPAENELQLYDIVVYETEGNLIIHRIIGIEEPNEKHPNERRFLLRGDANKYSDVYPVYYSQMRAIYEGQRIPLLGNFVMFLQAPAGWLCILLILFAIVATPIAEKKLQRERDIRLQMMLGCDGKLCKPLDVSVKPVVLSHFRVSLNIQRQDPKVCLRIQKNTGGVKITVKKGSEQNEKDH